MLAEITNSQKSSLSCTHNNKKTGTMDSSPDELYTLRAQFWLGHYNLCIDEAKSIARRPMSPQLKVEREEFYLRALLELKQFDDVVREASGGDKGPGWYFCICGNFSFSSPS